MKASIRRITVHFGLVIAFLVSFSSSSSIQGRKLKESDHCNETQHLYQLRGFSDISPSKPVPGMKLEICPEEYSCCTTEMEKNFQKQGSGDVVIAMKEKCSSVKNTFTKKHKKFDDFFQTLIENARTALDDLFFRTYGTLYSTHSAVFMQLFEDLKNYYHGKAVDVSEVFDTFFTVLTQRVFQLINPNYIMDDDYMQCIADNMNTVQPLDSSPETISSQVQRASIIAKTFVRGLDVGRMVVQNLAKFTPSADCEIALTRMTYCSACQAMPSSRPCHHMCMNVMMGCLVDYDAVSKVWKEYIDTMQIVLNRLESPFNIESVLDPLDVKISEAVMVLQENKMDITAAVFRSCGVPEKNPNVTDGLGDLNMMGHNMNFPDLDISNFPPFMESHADYSPYGETDSVEDFVFTEVERTKRSVEKESSRKRSKSTRGGRRNRHERHLWRNKEEKKTKKVTNKMTMAEGHRRMLKHSSIQETRYKYSEEQDAIDKQKHAAVHTALGTNLATLVTNTKKTLAEARDHWEMLPSSLCKDEADKINSTICWNGKGIGTYGHAVVLNGLKHQHSNPEITVPEDHQSHATIVSQINELKKIISELKTANKGHDPQHVIDDDDDDDFYQYSGDGGSADGSGDDDTPSPTLKAATTTPVVCPDCGSGNSLSQNFIPVLVGLLAASWVM